MDKYDTSQLTEFPRFEPETPQSGVSTFLNKIWKLPIFSQGESSEAKEKDNKPHQSQETSKGQNFEDVKPDPAAYAVELEGRSLSNVLQRISSLIALGSGGGTRYADTELARYWMPDDISFECYECAARFNTLRRKHHCRVCGQIFCSRCCSQRVPGQMFGCAGGLRVCNYCCNVVLSYLRENDMSGDMSPDLRTLQENLQTKFPEKRVSVVSTDHFNWSRDDSPPACKEPLIQTYRRLVHGLPTQPHRYRLVRYSGVWRGCDIIQWICDNTPNKTRAQSTLVCQSLLKSGYIECSVDLDDFADYGLYRPMPLPEDPEDIETPEECKRLVESVSSYCLDLNLGESSARMTKAPKNAESKVTPDSDEENPVLENNDESPTTFPACQAIKDSGDDHLRLLLSQLISKHGVSTSWLNVLYPLCKKAADMLVLDVHSTDIDPRNYIQVKKAPGGDISESCVINGVVMTKNVMHRGMPTQISNPSVLFLDCSISYQRVEGKLTTLEPVLMQEREYLLRTAARVIALGGNIILCSGSVSSLCVQALLSANIALVCKVGAKGLSRASRMARGERVTSVDARIGGAGLGRCKEFAVRQYSGKTLMILENYPDSHEACCILLRGASLQELIRVKKIAKFMILACYNWKLEKSFLCDIEAVLPDHVTPLNEKDDLKTTDAESNSNTNKSSDSKDVPSDIDVEGNQSKQDDVKSEISEEAKANINAEITNKSPNNTEVSTEMPKNTKDSVSEISDPLKAKPFRKTESDKTMSFGVPVGDFSDPLRARQMSVDDDVFLPKAEEVMRADDKIESWWANDVLLSISPHVCVPPPFLETEAGKKYKYKALLPKPVLTNRSQRPTTPAARRHSHKLQQLQYNSQEVHPFIKNPLNASIDDIAVRASLADFRAKGCGFIDTEHSVECPLYDASVVKKVSKDEKTDKNDKHTEPSDPLDPESHQHINLLLYSYSEKSVNMPDFCVNPWVLTMEMYGRRDITLGAFLEKYCFNGDNKCPSQNCSVPMNQHIRRFVHGDICLTITCNTIGHSAPDTADPQRRPIMVWCCCTVCARSGKARCVSRDTLSMSFARYLALRMNSARKRYIHGQHSIVHAFARTHHAARFRCDKISMYEVEFPPEIITTEYDTKAMRDSLINQLNDLMLKGHETFTSISEPEVEKDHLNFKQQLEQIHVALTSNSLQEQHTPAGVVKSLWNVYDRILLAEKQRRDTQDKFAAHKHKAHQNTIAEEREKDLEDSTSVDSATIESEVSRDDSDRPAGTEDDEEKGDKKTVRQILSQLLSNNQPANQAGIIIPGGVIPVLVCGGDVGSVIAATLASAACRNMCGNANSCSVSDETEITSSGKERDGDKNKTKSNNEHIEVMLREGLMCRVYFAQQFQKLRHMVLCPLESNDKITDEFADKQNVKEGEKPANKDGGCKCSSKSICELEEGFIRSLCECAAWPAQGGKSGSSFCKTKDDRYVLKEMSRPEWQQFLEFAPHYFNYVINCRQNKLPTLLVCILGVYSVGGSGDGVLVMGRLKASVGNSATSYDLKGSSRHRRALATQPVLLDDNLLALRLQSPLYLWSPAWWVLMSAIQRDTRFLADHHVMDYSMLLFVHDGTLSVGIIDYIRTFTWDKKLEHYVKKNLGSGQPTIVSPTLYRTRFITAMKKYFLQCAGHWDQLHNILITDCE